jgi:hypothetical protein
MNPYVVGWLVLVALMVPGLRASACAPEARAVLRRALEVGPAPARNVAPIIDYGAVGGTSDARPDLALPLAVGVELRQAGTVVPAVIEQFGTAVRIRPVAPLVAGLTYEVADAWTVPCTNEACRPGNPHVFGSFVPVAAVDRTPPAFAGLAVISARPVTAAGGACEPAAGEAVTFWWPSAREEHGEGPVRYNLYRRGDAGLELIAGLLEGRQYTGFLACGAAAPGFLATGFYLVHAVDLAGNEDSNERALELVASPCGQAAAAGDSAPGATPASLADAGAGGCAYGGPTHARSFTGSLVFLLMIGAWASSSARRRNKSAARPRTGSQVARRAPGVAGRRPVRGSR